MPTDNWCKGPPRERCYRIGDRFYDSNMEVHTAGGLQTADIDGVSYEIKAYSGLVRVVQPCILNGLRRSPGNVEVVKDQVLWDDDSFEPIVRDGTNRLGEPLYRRADGVQQIPAKFRALGGDVTARRTELL